MRARGRLEKAKAKVLEEEEGLVKVEKELAEVEESIRAHREEDERKEKARREEARRAREPKCMEVEESGEEEANEDDVEEEEVNLEGGKRRKVVRKVRPSKVEGVDELDMVGLLRALQKLSKEN